MTDREQNERVASVEARIDNLDSRLSVLHYDMREVYNELKAIREGVYRQRGFIAGMIAAFTALWAVVAGLGAMLWRTLT